ncbi:MAG: hypothetical protein ACU0CA_17540 [Paracoccaceae bacterium]
MIRAPLSPALTPLATKLGVRPLYGDIHNHCALSYGHGSLEGALQRARLQLDFVSITGHAYWPDMPVDEPSVAHIVDFHREGFAKLAKGWIKHFDTLQEYDDDGVFSVFPGYEIHSSAHGDYTIIYADTDPAEIVLADDPRTLGISLELAKGDRALAFPHHIGYRIGARGINWDSFDPHLSPFVEMFSMHGCAESSENERGYLHSMGPLDGANTMQSGLARGAVFGVVGNTDHHSGFPGSYGHGRTGLYAKGCDKEAIWNALRGRHTNALTGDNVHLLTAVGTAIQGDCIAPQKQATFEIEAVCNGFIDTIDVIRNGQLVKRISPDLSPAPAPPTLLDRTETILFVELGWGAREKTHDWTGSVTINDGKILSVEPRFRGPEIVSPLEGDDTGHALPRIECADAKVSFSVIAEANPNNMTPATQGFAIRLSLSQDAVIHANLGGAEVTIPASRLFESAVSGNLGIIDTPAYRLHMMPLPHQWQWHGKIDLGKIEHGENLYVRLRQRDGQMAWTSPIFCKETAI